MAEIQGNRYQSSMFPMSIDEYVSDDDPVRVYDAFIDAINLTSLGFKEPQPRPGAPSYHQRTMVKILVYSYSYGWRSSRKIERALHHNVSFIWLSSGLKPDHKTIANFRRKNKSAFKELLKQCAKFCVKAGLIEGNILFLDGCKMRANAGINSSKTRDGFKKQDEVLSKRISQLLEDIEQTDKEEKDHGSMEQIKQKVKKLQKKQGQIQKLVSEIEEEEEKYNSTDNDSKVMKSRQGSHACFNVQVSTDDKHGLIVHADATDSRNDHGELYTQSEKADENLGFTSKVLCADAGYANVKQADDLRDKKQLIIPTTAQASRKKPKNFDKQNFEYNEQEDVYICPEGEKLYRSSYREKKQAYKYAVKGNPCKSCKHFGECTTNKHSGREINRLLYAKGLEKLEEDYNNPENKAIYRRRQFRAEIPFGHIKRNLSAGYMLLRGKEGANAEMSILSSCYNLTRMINILGGVKNTLKVIQQNSMA